MFEGQIRQPNDKREEAVEAVEGENVAVEGKTEGKVDPEIKAIANDIRIREGQKTNVEKLSEIKDKIMNYDALRKANQFMKDYKAEIDMCGVNEKDYKDLVKKMFTPHRADEQDAAYLLMDKYGEDVITRVADNLRQIALELGDSAFAGGVVTLLRVTKRADEAATDKDLYGVIGGKK